MYLVLRGQVSAEVCVPNQLRQAGVLLRDVPLRVQESSHEGTEACGMYLQSVGTLVHALFRCVGGVVMPLHGHLYCLHVFTLVVLLKMEWTAWATPY